MYFPHQQRQYVNNPLIFTDGGNFFGREAAPMQRGYREFIRKWADNYEAACANCTKYGRPVNDMDTLQYQMRDADICLDGYAPREDQVVPILLALNWGRLALFADMGAGKTFMAGYIMKYWQMFGPLANEKKSMLVVAPKSVCREWSIQLPMFFGTKVKTFPTDRDFLSADVVVTNYEQLEAVLHHRDKFMGVVLDESQRAKNVETKTYQNLSLLVDLNIWHRMVLTGTPIRNKADDLFAQLSFINPYAFPFTHAAMLKTHFRSFDMKGRTVYKFKESSAPLFAGIADRNSLVMASPAREAGAESKTESLGMTAEQRSFMKQVANGKVELMKQNIGSGNIHLTSAVKNALMRELQISSGFIGMGDGEIHEFPSLKMARMFEIVTDEWKDHQIIVWVYFRETANRIKRTLNQTYGVRMCDIIMGGMSNNARETVLNEFKHGKLRVLVGQLTAMNAGLNLQYCQHNLFVEWDWAPSVMDQAVARIDRPGQTQKCFHRFLYTDETADLLQVWAYRNKRKVNTTILQQYASKSAIGKVSLREIGGLNKSDASSGKGWKDPCGTMRLSMGTRSKSSFRINL